MYILSRDKKSLIQFTKINVSKNFGGGKTEKFALTAIAADSAMDYIVATYPEEKLALLELERIVEALKENQTVYEIQ